MLTLFDFQHKAVDQITERFAAYLDKRPGRVVGTKVTYVPYYQALASITASGKTVIMAQTRCRAAAHAPRQCPVVLWLSKGRVVVDQTLANLSGKYQHLLADYEDVQLLADYDLNDVADDSLALVYLATVGTFNQKSKDKSSLRLFRSDIDNADQVDVERAQGPDDGLGHPSAAHHRLRRGTQPHRSADRPPHGAGARRDAPGDGDAEAATGDRSGHRRPQA